MLNGTLALHDIRDVEAFCTTIVQSQAWTHTLDHTDREDLTAWLITKAWELSRTYQPHRNITFSTYAGTTLRRRTIDWRRQRYGRTTWQFKGRTHHRTTPTLISYDNPTHHPEIHQRLAEQHHTP